MNGNIRYKRNLAKKGHDTTRHDMTEKGKIKNGQERKSEDC